MPDSGAEEYSEDPHQDEIIEPQAEERDEFDRDNFERDKDIEAAGKEEKIGGANSTSAVSENDGSKYAAEISEKFGVEENDLVYKTNQTVDTVGIIKEDGELYFKNPTSGEYESGKEAWGDNLSAYEAQKNELAEKGSSIFEYFNPAENKIQYMVQEKLGNEIRSHLYEREPKPDELELYAGKKIETTGSDNDAQTEQSPIVINLDQVLGSGPKQEAGISFSILGKQDERGNLERAEEEDGGYSDGFGFNFSFFRQTESAVAGTAAVGGSFIFPKFETAELALPESKADRMDEARENEIQPIKTTAPVPSMESLTGISLHLESPSETAETVQAGAPETFTAISASSTIEQNQSLDQIPDNLFTAAAEIAFASARSERDGSPMANPDGLAVTRGYAEATMEGITIGSDQKTDDGFTVSPEKNPATANFEAQNFVENTVFEENSMYESIKTFATPAIESGDNQTRGEAISAIPAKPLPLELGEYSPQAREGVESQDSHHPTALRSTPLRSAYENSATIIHERNNSAVRAELPSMSAEPLLFHKERQGEAVGQSSESISSAMATPHVSSLRRKSSTDKLHQTLEITDKTAASVETAEPRSIVSETEFAIESLEGSHAARIEAKPIIELTGEIAPPIKNNQEGANERRQQSAKAPVILKPGIPVKVAARPGITRQASPLRVSTPSIYRERVMPASRQPAARTREAQPMPARETAPGRQEAEPRQAASPKAGTNLENEPTQERAKTPINRNTETTVFATEGGIRDNTVNAEQSRGRSNIQVTRTSPQVASRTVSTRQNLVETGTRGTSLTANSTLGNATATTDETPVQRTPAYQRAA